jgi:hypothetical protein
MVVVGYERSPAVAPGNGVVSVRVRQAARRGRANISHVGFGPAPPTAGDRVPSQAPARDGRRKASAATCARGRISRTRSDTAESCAGWGQSSGKRSVNRSMCDGVTGLAGCCTSTSARRERDRVCAPYRLFVRTFTRRSEYLARDSRESQVVRHDRPRPAQIVAVQTSCGLQLC